MKVIENTENTTCRPDCKDDITRIKEAVGIKPLEVKFRKMDDRAVIPTYAHNGDVGMDLTAIDVEYDEKNDMYIYHTGLAFESDYHYGQLLFPRSSNRKTDAYLCNHVGIADSAIYRGEIMLCFKNRDSIDTIANIEGMKAQVAYLNSCGTELEYTQAWIRGGLDAYLKAQNKVFEAAKNLAYAPYQVGDRVAQMVFISYPDVHLRERSILSETDRGEGGFGSTGK